MNTDKSLKPIYDSLLPELLAIPEERVVHVNRALAPVISTVSEALDEVRKLVESSGSLPGLDAALVDRLDRCLVALEYANLCYRTRAQPHDDELPELKKKAVELRKCWLMDLEMWRVRGLIDLTPIEGVAVSNAYDQVALRLQLMVAFMRQHWDMLQGHFLTLEDLNAGDELALQMLRACALRKQRTEESARASEMQKRAFTLLLRTYDRVRRAVELARCDEGDASSIAPSVYQHRRDRRGGIEGRGGARAES